VTACVTGVEITHREQAGWQRRAATQLAAILDVHRDLPIIAWTVGSAGASLVGHVNGLAPADEVRRVFQAWQAALAVTGCAEVASSGVVLLRATAVRGRVRIALTATVFHDADEDEAVTR
jgi:hypothetical protein